MPTKSHNIRMDEDIKNKAAALYAGLGLTLSDAVNVFLRVSLNENGFPFPVKLRESEEAALEREKKATEAFIAFANANPVSLGKGYKFKREDCYDRKVLR